ncbi:MAG: CBS domain-containing protein, partial [Alphaproteobacteria bacterium]|nr:CBS domain-containing protein [Alphaproteobacteria bacterium]
MLDSHIGGLPVMDQVGRFVGVLTERDLFVGNYLARVEPFSGTVS